MLLSSVSPLIVDPAEQLALPVVAGVDQGVVALGAVEAILVPRTVRQTHHKPNMSNKEIS